MSGPNAARFFRVIARKQGVRHLSGPQAHVTAGNERSRLNSCSFAFGRAPWFFVDANFYRELFGTIDNPPHAVGWLTRACDANSAIEDCDST